MKHTLEDWQDHVEANIKCEITVASDAIRVIFPDERQIWIEYEEGKIRIHAFDAVNEEPTNMDIEHDRVTLVPS